MLKVGYRLPTTTLFNSVGVLSRSTTIAIPNKNTSLSSTWNFSERFPRIGPGGSSKFHTSTASMVAQKIDGTAIAKYPLPLVVQELIVGRFENRLRMRLKTFRSRILDLSLVLRLSRWEIDLIQVRMFA